jgi:hypothetical protein
MHQPGSRVGGTALAGRNSLPAKHDSLCGPGARCDISDRSDRTIMPCLPRGGHGGTATLSQPVSITPAHQA